MARSRPGQVPYRDREEAGDVLAGLVAELALKQPLVLAIPNGGVPVAARVAAALGAPLRVFIVRKLQIPWNTEAGFGALAPDGALLLNRRLVAALELGPDDIERQKQKAMASIRERQGRFGKWADLPDVAGRPVVLVDDGLASGFTMAAAVRSVGTRGAGRIVVAVPTASDRAARLVGALAANLVCPDIRSGQVFAVANAYESWYDVSEDEALAVLEAAGAGP